MSDAKDNTGAERLKAQLACDQKRLKELRMREVSLLQHISHQGFCTQIERNNLLCEMQKLQSSIEKSKEMLTMARQ